MFTVRAGDFGSCAIRWFLGLLLVAAAAVPAGAVVAPTVRVNSGGPAWVAPDGVQWAADAGFSGGRTGSVTASISGTTTPKLYQSARVGTFAYQFALPDGTYQVTLKFAELWANGANKRKFAVDLNGRRVLDNFDIFAVSGGRYKATDRSFSTTVTGGRLLIAFTGQVGNALICAIEAVAAPPAGGGAPPAVSVTVTPPSAQLTASQTQTFTAAVSGTANTAVNWSLSPAVGTLSTTGTTAVYTAPSTIEQSQTVEVTATSMADPTKFAKALITLVPVVAVTVSPATATLKAGQSQQFVASVTGSTNKSVRWSLSPAVGAISSSGVYSAPSSVPVAQQVYVTATAEADPTKSASASVQLEADERVTFTTNSNGLATLVYKGVDYNYLYGEQLLSWVIFRNADGTTASYTQFPCARTFSATSVTHQCTTGSGPVEIQVNYEHCPPAGICADVTLSNRASVPIERALVSTLGIRLSQFDQSRSRLVLGPSSPVAWANFVTGQWMLWVDTPADDTEVSIICGWSIVCKNQPRIWEIKPGESKRRRFCLRFTSDPALPAIALVPEAYERFREAWPPVVNWPDRRPIMAWWIADNGKISSLNPRGYLWDPNLDVSNRSLFRDRVLQAARRVRDSMNARPVRPQGLIVWDLEGQEFKHATTYIGDPRVFQFGYATEMDAVVDEMFAVFRDAGYRVGVTVRPQYLGWGTALPSQCRFAPEDWFKEYFIKVDNPFGARFHGCTDPNGEGWTVFPNSNGSQTNYREGQDEEILALLRSKISYARQRWGATLFYVDSAVYPGGKPLHQRIYRQLQQEFPEILLIPEQEYLPTLGVGLPYAEARLTGDPKFAPVTWRWAYPAGAFVVALQNCLDSCWSSNYEHFRVGQKIGDIALYAQPGQMNLSHLDRIETMIREARAEASRVTVQDRASGRELSFTGQPDRILNYPVKMRVYFAPSAAAIGSSTTYCEAGQWLGENRCELDLTGMTAAQVRYFDFTGRFVSAEPVMAMPQ